MSDSTRSFLALNLSEKLLKAVSELGFTQPSPIQQQTIPLMLQKKDVIALAQTGTGKTAAFALPILQHLDESQAVPQALVLAPTRELAIQVGEHFSALAVHMPSVRVSVLCGGQDYRPQLKKLRDGAHIIVGTPGRILDHLERKTLQLQQLKTLVLDEADEMLRMGFIEDVETVLKKLPAVRQIGLFSATMPPRIRQIANNYLNQPVSVEIRSETATVKAIEQRFIFVSPAQKPEALLRILAVEDYQGVIVFVRTKTSAEEVAERLVSQGLSAMAIHGDISQALRERVIMQFKQGVIDILVATDVAARGLDVERVTHVINYDMAHDCETYVHRIGRTGRAGRSGVTVLFATHKEARMLSMIERHTRQKIEKTSIPNNATIQSAKERRLLLKITDRLQNPKVADYRRIVATYLQEHPEVSPIDVAAALGLMLHHDKSWDLKLPELREEMARRESKPSYEREERNRHTKKSHTDRERFQDKRFANEYPSIEFRIDVGRVHGVKPGNIVGAIANEAGLQSRFITALKIHDDHSTVCLPKGMPKDVMQKLTKAWICGRQLNLQTIG